MHVLGLFVMGERNIITEGNVVYSLEYFYMVVLKCVFGRVKDQNCGFFAADV